MRALLTLILLTFTLTACANTLRIHQKPIKFDKDRFQLTRAYRWYHYGIRSRDINIDPRMIVVHWTGTSSFDHAFRTLNASRLRGRPGIAKGGSLNVSAHFLIARNGDVYQLMPTNKMARHVIGLNNVAIGIENVGSNKNPLTGAQLDANVKLVCYLKKKYPDIRYVIGHYEYTRFRNTRLWQERHPEYCCTRKTDPGKDFMKKLRKRIAKCF